MFFFPTDVTNDTTEKASLPEKNRFVTRRHRRQRAKYTSRQLLELEMEFERNPYPNAWDRERLGYKLGIHDTRIQVCVVQVSR